MHKLAESDSSETGLTAAAAGQDEIPAELGISAQALSDLSRDLGRHRMGIYWSDLLLSLASGYGALFLFPLRSPFSVFGLICGMASTLTLFRAAVFTHELVHMPGQKFASFRLCWNILCGIPLLIPSFMYEIHLEHHAKHTYGTKDDGEYLSFTRLPRLKSLQLILVSFVAVPAFFVRFLLLAPVGWMSPGLRRKTLSHSSALVIDGEYERQVPPGAIPRRWTVQEAACFFWCLLLLLLVLLKVIPVGRVIEAYAVITAILLINAFRVLGAHGYRGTGEPMSFADQVGDSHNFPYWFAEVWAPLGLRFHALHHLLPSLPYHALAEAHRRLLDSVAPNSVYRTTLCRSLRTVLSSLLRLKGIRI